MAESRLPADKPADEEILVMAVSLYGLSHAAMRKQYANACGRPILTQALRWRGDWNEASRTALFQDVCHPALDHLYDQLIGMCKQPRALVKGYGNLGSEHLPASAPPYVAFGLTSRGRKMVERLFVRLPQYRTAPHNSESDGVS